MRESESSPVATSAESAGALSAEQLTPLLYQELRSLAQSLFRNERADHTIQPTALVHEAYLRLAESRGTNWQTPANFLGIAARVMRQVLVDHARQHRAAKRGSGAGGIEFDERLHGESPVSMDVIRLHEALNELAAVDSRKARIIELKYFGGLTGEEIATEMEISPATVARDVKMAQAWLYLEFRGELKPK